MVIVASLDTALARLVHMGLPCDDVEWHTLLGVLVCPMAGEAPQSSC
jgi:hypothetical protein